MDNTEALEKLARIIYAHRPDDFDAAQGVLAAFQDAPLAYVKPKPLKWKNNGDRWVTDILDVDYYVINYDRRSSVGDYSLFIRGEWKPYPTLEAAQAAAYDDLCKRVGELF